MTSVFTDHVLRVDPDQFPAVAHNLETAATDTEAALTRLAAVVEDYRAHHEGPDIEVINAAGTALVDSLRTTIAGYDDLAAAFRRAGTSLQGVGDDAARLWNEAQAVPAEAMTVAAPGLEQRFEQLRDDEDAILAGLAATIDTTPTGTPSAADQAALLSVFSTPLSSGLSPALSLQLRLALALLIDVDASAIGIIPAASTEGSRAALADVKDILEDGGDHDVSEGQLDDIHRMFVGLSDGELQYVLANLNDNQLDVLFHNVHSSGFWSNDWNDGERRDFYDNLARVGRTGPPELWNRLGQFSPAINPDPALGQPDGAREVPADARRWAALAYHPTTAPLWSPGSTPIDPGDIRQGSVGDCYLVAALITLARQNPDAIRDLISVNPNGTYTVTFADGTSQVVTADVPVNPAGRPEFARTHSGTAAWPQIVEKAYAQQNGGWGRDPGISGGRSNEAIEQLTGQKADYIKAGDLSLDDLADRWDQGQYLGLSTIDRPAGMSNDEWLKLETTPDAFKGGKGTYDRLHQDHAFVVTDVDRDSGTVSVLNPWDPSQPPLVLGFDDLQESVNGVYVNESLPAEASDGG